MTHPTPPDRTATANSSHASLGQRQGIFPSAGKGAAVLRWVVPWSACMGAFILLIRQDSVGIAIAAINFSIAVACFAYVRWELSLKAELYERGLIRYHNSQAQIIAFSDIAEIRDVPQYSAKRPTKKPRAWQYDLLLQDGQRVHLSGLQRIRILGREIGEQIVALQFAPTCQRLQAGESLAFGRLEVDADGLQHEKTRLQWGEIGYLGVTDRGQFAIARRDQSQPAIQLLPWDVANVPLLQRLWQHFTQTAQPQPSRSLGSTIGEISARLGHDIRELHAMGYSQAQIDPVIYGEKSLHKLLSEKPESPAM